MKAKKHIFKSEGLAAIGELVRLNPRAGGYFDETIEVLSNLIDKTPFQEVCRLAEAATVLGTAECSDEEMFLTGSWGPPEYPNGYAYRGQFTPGRYIGVGHDLNGIYIYADTGTARKSTYFSTFRCMREHLPELCEIAKETT